jgi:bifunctional non-homologous end joining protein LigD
VQANLSQSQDIRFTSLKAALTKLPVQSAIIDGEIVCLGENGVSRFHQLLKCKGEPIFYAFDLLWIDGEDLRDLSLIQRKRLARSMQRC